MKKEQISKVIEAFHALDMEERIVVKWRLGAGAERKLSLAEISDVLRISRERVRQIEAKAYEKIGRTLKTK